MAAGEASGETTRRLLFPVLVSLITVTVLLSAVATVPLVGAENAGTEPSTGAGEDAFGSFTIDFESADPEEPDDVAIEWDLSADADDVERVRIAITNESGRPIIVFRPTGENVPNAFTVSEGSNDGKHADILVDDLSAATLELKIPPGHCDRVDAVAVTALDGSDEATAEPNIERPTSCTPTADAASFDVRIDEVDEEVSAGAAVTVTAKIENTGTTETTQDVRLLIDGEEVEVTNLTLAAKQNETVHFSHETTLSDVGEHEVVVASDDDAARRQVNVTVPSSVVTIPTDETATGEPEDLTPIEASFEDETDTETGTVEPTDTDGSESDSSAEEERSTGDTSAADSDVDDTGSDGATRGETFDSTETESVDAADTDDSAVGDSDGGFTADRSDTETSDTETSDREGSDTEGSDTDGSADSDTVSGDTDETALAFFPILGLLVLPMLVSTRLGWRRNRESAFDV